MMEQKQPTIAMALNVCEQKVRHISRVLSEKPLLMGCAVGATPIPVDMCQEIYKLALEVGATDLLAELSPPPLWTTPHDVLSRWTCLRDWCRRRLAAFAKEGSAHPDAAAGTSRQETPPRKG